MHPLRPDLPIYLAAQGPKNTALAAEIADGWLPAFFSPRLDAEARRHLATGFARRDAQLRPSSDFEVGACVPVALGPDVEHAAALLKPQLALYIGGMGSTARNFHRNAIERLGYHDVCVSIADHYQAGDTRAAAAAVPTDLVLDVALAGNGGDLRHQLRRWQSSCVTSLLLQTAPQSLTQVVAALRSDC